MLLQLEDTKIATSGFSTNDNVTNESQHISLTFSTESGVIDKAGSGRCPPIVKKVDVVDQVFSVVRLLEI